MKKEEYVCIYVLCIAKLFEEERTVASSKTMPVDDYDDDDDRLLIYRI